MSNIPELRAALAQAQQHLNRCLDELHRYEEPQGGERRGTLYKLQADIERARNDCDLLSNQLWKAEHQHEEFEGDSRGASRGYAIL